MHFTPMSATLLAACIISADAAQAGPTGGVAPIEPAILTCPQAGNALGDRLCAALRQRLATVPPLAGPLQLTLQVDSPRPHILRARLVTDDGTTRRDGPQLELTVMDRASIPDSQLQQFAQLMLDQAISFYR